MCLDTVLPKEEWPKKYLTRKTITGYKIFRSMTKKDVTPMFFDKKKF